ncbi:MAG: helix-turn-helix transcriptional regulator [Burkholderiales bacterium]|nr:helix-turn-helix transcriptional regulator [Burkholderiales bacterium]
MGLSRILNMPARSTLPSQFEERLLLQLGERLRAARRARSLSSVELAGRVGISRTTLSAIEKGDPSPAFGTYLRVMSALGLASDLALVAAQWASSDQANKAAASRFDRHAAQDLQSLLMHREAVALLRADPSLVGRLSETLVRWSRRDDPNSRPLLQRWADIITSQDWEAILAETEEGQQLRQGSPLPTLLSEHTRLSIIHTVRSMREQSRATA